MTLTQEQVIAEVTKLNSTIERYYARTATYLAWGFVTGFVFGVAVMMIMR